MHGIAVAVALQRRPVSESCRAGSITIAAGNGIIGEKSDLACPSQRACPGCELAAGPGLSIRSLLQPDPGFTLQPYLKGLEKEFAALGINIDVSVKTNTMQTAIISAFLKPDTTIVQLAIGSNRSMKIKLEVDTNPPLGFETDEQLLLQPFSFYVKCFCLPDLFAGTRVAIGLTWNGMRVRASPCTSSTWRSGRDRVATGLGMHPSRPRHCRPC